LIAETSAAEKVMTLLVDSAKSLARLCRASASARGASLTAWRGSQPSQSTQGDSMRRTLLVSHAVGPRSSLLFLSHCDTVCIRANELCTLLQCECEHAHVAHALVHPPTASHTHTHTHTHTVTHTHTHTHTHVVTHISHLCSSCVFSSRVGLDQLLAQLSSRHELLQTRMAPVAVCTR
jgi:hypothetical protein